MAGDNQGLALQKDTAHVNGGNQKKPKGSPAVLWLYGVGFTFIIAFIGFWLAKVPGFSQVGPMACSIIIAVIYRQIFGYPEAIRQGIQFSAKKLLRYAIVLFGLKLNIDVIFHDGLGLLARDAGVIIFSIGVMMLIAKWFKADMSLSFLLGVGTGVCGASAIATVSSIVKSKEEDTAIGAGIIALMGTIFAVAYTILRPFLPLSAIDYGIWSGTSLHEIAHVALAGAPAGPDGLAIALLAKLGRVFLLVPLSFILVYWMKRKGKAEGQGKVEFPWFLIGFIIMSLIGSYVIGHSITISQGVMDNISSLTTFILTMAMVGLGLNVSFKDLRSRAMRPLLAMTITSVILSICAFFIA
ncbi:putative integral membrane protein (TIGR00698 family) [Scopulibacillus darangshiensis]|uniref:Putative integral membrane protein (TIGR00698 family) n=1 Tax=Scopulibacillus darangshiensis TaxID=442528 RepID=A0A4R2NYB6_9BACL|nr:putative sulfate exporter family transporter [Scopulibacillus darangshiensis]TCP27082.1 putative integral membrane protein (TIGR00698 family) [Scopulibacillus darangshiensis]